MSTPVITSVPARKIVSKTVAPSAEAVVQSSAAAISLTATSTPPAASVPAVTVPAINVATVEELLKSLGSPKKPWIESGREAFGIVTGSDNYAIPELNVVEVKINKSNNAEAHINFEDKADAERFQENMLALRTASGNEILKKFHRISKKADNSFAVSFDLPEDVAGFVETIRGSQQAIEFRKEEANKVIAEKGLKNPVTPLLKSTASGVMGVTGRFMAGTSRFFDNLRIIPGASTIAAITAAGAESLLEGAARNSNKPGNVTYYRDAADDVLKQERTAAVQPVYDPNKPISSLLSAVERKITTPAIAFVGLGGSALFTGFAAQGLHGTGDFFMNGAKNLSDKAKKTWDERSGSPLDEGIISSGYYLAAGALATVGSTFRAAGTVSRTIGDLFAKPAKSLFVKDTPSSDQHWASILGRAVNDIEDSANKSRIDAAAVSTATLPAIANIVGGTGKPTLTYAQEVYKEVQHGNIDKTQFEKALKGYATRTEHKLFKDKFYDMGEVEVGGKKFTALLKPNATFSDATFAIFNPESNEISQDLPVNMKAFQRKFFKEVLTQLDEKVLAAPASIAAVSSIVPSVVPAVSVPPAPTITSTAPVLTAPASTAAVASVAPAVPTKNVTISAPPASTITSTAPVVAAKPNVTVAASLPPKVGNRYANKNSLVVPEPLVIESAPSIAAQSSTRRRPVYNDKVETGQFTRMRPNMLNEETNMPFSRRSNSNNERLLDDDIANYGNTVVTNNNIHFRKPPEWSTIDSDSDAVNSIYNHNNMSERFNTLKKGTTNNASSRVIPTEMIMMDDNNMLGVGHNRSTTENRIPRMLPPRRNVSTVNTVKNDINDIDSNDDYLISLPNTSVVATSVNLGSPKTKKFDTVHGENPTDNLSNKVNNARGGGVARGGTKQPTLTTTTNNDSNA